MKNRVRIFGVILLTAIYSLVVCFVNNTIYSSDNNSVKTSSQEVYFSTNTFDYLCHTTQSESFVNSISNLTAASLKNIVNGFSVTIKINEQLSDSQFAKYSYNTLNILVIYCKADIIFPFDYFW